MKIKNLRVSMPAEWCRPQSGIMLAWPHAGTDWNYMLDEVQSCYVDIISAIAQELRVLLVAPDANDVAERLKSLPQGLTHNIIVAEVETNDTWTRDYGPITTIGQDQADGTVYHVLNDFKFNGWGLKYAADKDNLVNSRLNEKRLWQYIIERQNSRGILYNDLTGFVLEGGSVESDGKGTVMTTSRCLMSPNRNGNLNREQIEQRLKTYLGAERVLWVEHGELEGDDTDAHIDTLARFAPNNTIIYCGCDDRNDPHYDSLQALKQQLATFTTAEGEPYNMIELPLPDAIYDTDGQRLPATYANFLITPQRVLMPVYGQERKDRLAIQMMKIAFESRQIVPIDCRALIRQHGSLHCATMQIPAI